MASPVQRWLVDARSADSQGASVPPLLLLLIFGCPPSGGPPENGPPNQTDSGGDDGDGPEQVGSSTGDEVRRRSCTGLYDPDALLQFELDIPDDSWDGLESDFRNGWKNYHPATFTWEEETREVQVRLKGNPGFSWLSDKFQFVISFNEDDADARFHGVRKIALDAPWYEPTLLRDRLAWSILRELDEVPAACANSARLDINGTYYGLYTNIEYYDREWVEETFGDDHAQGVLWKYGTEAKTNESDADPAKVRAFFDASDVDDLEALGEPSQWLAVWAAEAALGDDDGYWCCAHNFYIYEHPTRDLLFVPWDLDDLFDVTPYDLHPIDGYPNSQGLFEQEPFLDLVADEAYAAVYREALAAAADALDPEVLVDRVETWAAQIGPSLAEDPHTSIGVEEHEQAIVRLQDYLVARHAYLDSWLACDGGSTADADGDDATVCEDPDDGDATIHPAAIETCNGRDDDADGLIDEAEGCEDCARHDFDDSHFLFCRTPRTWEDAQANCEDQGGTLTVPWSTADIYMTYWYTWPVFEGWWMGATDVASEGAWVSPEGDDVEVYDYWASGEPDGGASENCGAWDPEAFGWADLDCAESHPSICRL